MPGWFHVAGEADRYWQSWGWGVGGGDFPSHLVCEAVKEKEMINAIKR